MAFTTTDRDNLKAAIASGEMTVSYQGRTVTFRSIPELLKALAVVEAELAAVNGAVPTWPSGRRIAKFSSGLIS